MMRGFSLALLCLALAGCNTTAPQRAAYIPASYGLEDVEADLMGLSYAMPARSYAVQAANWAAIDAANQRAAGNALQGMGPRTCAPIYGSPGQISCN